MEIKVSTENRRVPVTVIDVAGNIDSGTHMAFQKKAEELIKNGARYILVDLTDVPYMSSAGLRALSAILNQLRSANADISEEDMLKGINEGTYKSPHLKLLNLSKQTQTAFDTAGFDMYVETFTDFQKALSSF
jgi:anti-anti-sigma factor